MSTSLEIQNIAKILTEGAVFSAAHTSLGLLCLAYFDYIYIIGKCESWLALAYFVCGAALNALIVSKKRTKVFDRDKKVFKTKPEALKFYNVLKGCMLLVTSVIAFYVIAVLFGAPLYSAQEETFMFSVLLTVLAVLPLLLNLGLDTTTSVLLSATALEKDVLCAILTVGTRCVLFGAWLGAVLIPLDWDRPWQVWPVPCSIGAIIGYLVSHLFVLTLNLPKVANLFNQMLIRNRRKYEL